MSDFIECDSSILNSADGMKRLKAFMLIGIAIARRELAAPPGVSEELWCESMEIVTAIGMELQLGLDEAAELGKGAPGAADILADAFAVANNKAGRRSVREGWEIARRRSDVARITARNPNAKRVKQLAILEEDYGFKINAKTLERDVKANRTKLQT
jgi:hypothetical protein